LERTRSVGERTELRPRKDLGQHFLNDPGLVNKIISRARFPESDCVLEIGPGRGALTLPLARAVGHVTAVEKDVQLTRFLNEKLDRAGISNVTLINHDILQWDFNEIKAFGQDKVKIIGNLPYNISSPLLEKIILNRDLVSRAVFMFQSEVARRLTASPGCKAYGAMTLLVRYHAFLKVLLEVPKEAFYPRPKVDSTVLWLDFERPYPRRARREEVFKKVVKSAFAHRRKTLLNSMRTGEPLGSRETLQSAMERCKIDPKRRAETLDMDEFLCLADALD